jgi:hypothetical protein
MGSKGKGLPSSYGARKTRQAAANRPSNWGGGKSSSVAVRWSLPAGMMLIIGLAVVRSGWGWTPSPLAVVIGASVMCFVSLAAVIVIAHRTPASVVSIKAEEL